MDAELKELIEKSIKSSVSYSDAMLKCDYKIPLKTSELEGEIFLQQGSIVLFHKEEADYTVKLDHDHGNHYDLLTLHFSEETFFQYFRFLDYSKVPENKRYLNSLECFMQLRVDCKLWIHDFEKDIIFEIYNIGGVQEPGAIGGEYQMEDYGNKWAALYIITDMNKFLKIMNEEKKKKSTAPFRSTVQ